jgi:hypothetical protein
VATFFNLVIEDSYFLQNKYMQLLCFSWQIRLCLYLLDFLSVGAIYPQQGGLDGRFPNRVQHRKHPISQGDYITWTPIQFRLEQEMKHLLAGSKALFLLDAWDRSGHHACQQPDYITWCFAGSDAVQEPGHELLLRVRDDDIQHQRPQPRVHPRPSASAEPAKLN